MDVATSLSMNSVWPGAGSSSTPGPDDEVAHMQHALRDKRCGMIPASDQSSADVVWGLNENVDGDGNVLGDRGACILDCVDFQPSSSAHIRISGHVSSRVQVLTFESAAMFCLFTNRHLDLKDTHFCRVSAIVDALGLPDISCQGCHVALYLYIQICCANTHLINDL